MRLFHTSDTHLGHQQYAALGPDGLNVRERDIAAAFNAVVDAAIAERPDAFLHAGDLFDGVRPGNRALAVAMAAFHRLSQAGIPTVVIAGNHEHPRMRGTGSPFRLFEHLNGIHVVYQGRRETISLDTPAGQLHIHAVPQCADQEVLNAEVAAIERLPGKNVLMLHGAVRSLEAFRNAEFNEQILEPKWFDDRFDYVALGHYHGVTEIHERAWYCGASERVSIAESGEQKGYLRITLGNNFHVDHIVVAGRPYADLPILHAKGLDASGVADAVTQQLARVPEGAVARLRVVDVDPSLRGVLDIRALQRAGSHALHCELKWSWQERADAGGGDHLEFGSLRDEFQAFARTQPLGDVDRDTIERLAAEVLEEAHQ